MGFSPLFMAGIDTAVRYRHFSERNLETKDQWETDTINRDVEIETAKCGRTEYVFYSHCLFDWALGPNINQCLPPQRCKVSGKMDRRKKKIVRITKTTKTIWGLASSQMTEYWFLWKIFLVRYESVIEICICRQQQASRSSPLTFCLVRCHNECFPQVWSCCSS